MARPSAPPHDGEYEATFCVTGLSRRGLLRAAVATAAAGSVPGALSAPAAAAAGLDYSPAIVVGSGYGGAVTALRLGQAGITTTVLEMGRSWTQPGADGKKFSSTLLADGRAMWFRDRTAPPLETLLYIPIDLPISRYAGVLDKLEYGDMSVYVGRGLGGGSLVNGGMAVTPRRQDFASFFPQVDAAAMYRTYFPRATAALRANNVPRAWFEKTEIHQFSRVARGSTQRSGFATAFVPSVYDYGYLQREARGEVPASATAQEIFYGNNFGKVSLDKSYWPMALATGKVSIATLTQVKGVRREADGTYVLSLVTIDEQGRRLSAREIACTYLFLTAGTIGTTEILLRARELGTLPNLSPRIGEGWGNNGNITVARWNPITRPTGAHQTTMPAMGIDNRDDPRYPLFAEITPMPMGIENWTTGYLGIAKNPERGRIGYDANTDRATLTWSRSQAEPAIASLRNVLDKINRTEGTDYRADLYRNGRVFGDHYTWHSLGGCVLGQVTDAYGRVPGAPGVYVNDGSLLPGYASVNPFVTITALAERNIERVIAQDITRR